MESYQTSSTNQGKPFLHHLLLNEVYDLKYKLTDETIIHKGQKLYRIEALKDFGDVKKGDKGGFIKSEKCLKHDGLCWVYHNAKVLDRGRVEDDAKVTHDAVIFKGKVSSNAVVSHMAQIVDADIRRNTQILDNALISNQSKISESIISGSAYIDGFEIANSKVGENVKISGNGYISGSTILGEVIIRDEVSVYDMEIGGRVILTDRMYLKGPGKIVDANEVLYISGLPLDKNITAFRANNKIKMFTGPFEVTTEYNVYGNHFHNHLIRMAYQMALFHFNNPKF